MRPCPCRRGPRSSKQIVGSDRRFRSSVQIDDIYKIDLPPDTYYHVVRHGIDLSELAHLFVTHSHPDHLDIAEMGFMRPPFAHNLKHAPIKVYGNETVTSAIRSRYGEATLPIELITVEPFVPINADKLTFTPITAHHNPNELCVNYVIESDSARVLYASDTGEYEQPTLDYLRAREYNLLIIECTQGTSPSPATYHMSFEAVLRLRDALGASARTVITHFSHNIGLLHEELEAIANPEGVEVAYDGIVLEV